MSDKTKGQKVVSFVGWLAALLASFSAILTFAGWLFYPHVSDFVMGIIDERKGASTKELLAKEMSTSKYVVKKDDVCEKLGEMYKESLHRHESEDKILDKWIPYLQDKSEWRVVGYFVSVDDSSIIEYHHSNGRILEAYKETDTGKLYHYYRGIKYY